MHIFFITKLLACRALGFDPGSGISKCVFQLLGLWAFCKNSFNVCFSLKSIISSMILPYPSPLAQDFAHNSMCQVKEVINQLISLVHTDSKVWQLSENLQTSKGIQGAYNTLQQIRIAEYLMEIEIQTQIFSIYSLLLVRLTSFQLQL